MVIEYDEFQAMMEPLVQWCKERRAFNDALEVLGGGCAEMTLGDSIADKYIELISSIMRIDADVVYWYLFDNECGKVGLKGSVAGVERGIYSLKALYWVLKEAK